MSIGGNCFKCKNLLKRKQIGYIFFVNAFHANIAISVDAGHYNLSTPPLSRAFLTICIYTSACVDFSGVTIL